MRFAYIFYRYTHTYRNMKMLAGELLIRTLTYDPLITYKVNNAIMYCLAINHVKIVKCIARRELRESSFNLFIINTKCVTLILSFSNKRLNYFFYCHAFWYVKEELINQVSGLFVQVNLKKKMNYDLLWNRSSLSYQRKLSFQLINCYCAT